MTAKQLSPVAEALAKLDEGAYFIPKEVKDWLSDADNGPLHFIRPWKTKETGWYVFTAPPGEIEIAKDTMDVEITHLFVSGRFDRGDMMKDSLFNYYMGQYDESRHRWRFVNPDKADKGVFQLTAWKECTVLNTWTDERDRYQRAAWWR